VIDDRDIKSWMVESETMSELPAVRLPSERQNPGDPRRIGFQADPSERHVDHAAEAMCDLVDRVSMSGPPSAQVLRVCLCLVRLPPRLPFNLFGFNIVGIGADGEFEEDLTSDGEIVYALVVNQPVDLQREIVLTFLNDLVGRQIPLAEIAAGRRSIGDLPEMTAAADASSAEATSDALRFSLRHATEALKTRAAGLDYRLEVRFRRDPLPSREQVVRRAHLLRCLYDTELDIRAAVDSTVAMVGGKPMALRGAPEETRVTIQGKTALLGVRQFFNQALRDADVTGNGFVQFGAGGLEGDLRCLRPEDVVVLTDGALRSAKGEEKLDRVLHLRGLEQFDSPYGISPWEPLLYVLQRRSVLEGATELMKTVIESPGATESDRDRAARSLSAAEAIDADTKSRLDQLLWFPRRRLNEVRKDLYFNGQELFGE
jgi:hypothetical protein